MINSLCGSMESLRSTCENSSSKQPPPSPTVSVSESSVLVSHIDPNINQSSALAAALKFDVDIDAEIQSPDSSIWETLFSDQIDSGADFMISSPKRDYFMVSSPNRDYMVSSPKREYMISSPKREYMVSSPKREYTVSSPKRTGINSIYNHNYDYVNAATHGHSLLCPPPPCNNSYLIGGFTSTTHNHKGKSQSPLHKVYNNKVCNNSPQYVHGESLALPSVDEFLDDYHRDSNYEITYPAGIRESGIDCLLDGFEMPSTLPAMLDCPPMPMSRFCGSIRDTTPAGMQVPEERDLYQLSHFATGPLVSRPQEQQQQQQQQQQQRDPDRGLLVPMSAKSEQVEASYHGLLGPISTESLQEQDSGLQLVHLLLACAEAVAKDDYMSARRYLHHLNRAVSPLGDSMQRVAACFTDALAARLTASTSSSSPTSAKPPLPSLAPLTHDDLKIYQILYQACPYIKFAHFTANQAIFEAFESEERVHVIDLDILEGYQWPAFMQALAARPGGPPFLRITGVGFPPQAVRETGRHLTELAHSLRVPFEFHPVGERLEDLQPHMLHRRVGEALAVNSVCQLHRVPGVHLGSLVGMIRDQAPNIVTLVEQEASHNGSYFLGRFLEALHYYSAIFDSLDATFPADSEARAKVEQYIFAPEIRNVVACEGADRVERHEKLEKWRKIMEGKGFKGVPLSANAVTQSKILLGLYSCDGYRLTEDKGCLLLGWQDRAVIAASAWRC